MTDNRYRELKIGSSWALGEMPNGSCFPPHSRGKRVGGWVVIRRETFRERFQRFVAIRRLRRQARGRVDD